MSQNKIHLDRGDKQVANTGVGHTTRPTACAYRVRLGVFSCFLVVIGDKVLVLHLTDKMSYAMRGDRVTHGTSAPLVEVRPGFYRIIRCVLHIVLPRFSL